MQVHEPRHNRPPSQVHAVSIGIVLKHFGFCSNSDDRFTFANDRALLDNAEISKLQPPLGTPREGYQL
jgi:hypothetical protein